jgi:hypothetical protein
MSQLANVGDFCPNEACSDYGKLQDKQSKRNIKKHGHKACNGFGVEPATKPLRPPKGRFFIVAGHPLR